MLRLEPLIEHARHALLPLATAPLDTLPLLERYRRRRSASLAGVDVLFVQHQLAPFTARVRAMYDDGLERSRAWFLDIPYSTSRVVRRHLRERLPSDRQIAEPFDDPFACYSRAQHDRAMTLLTRLADRSGDGRVLVVDDGAYVLRTLASAGASDGLRERFRGARVVEQTTRGHRFLESAEGHRIVQDLDIVAVSVARTATKVRFEAPCIGAAVAQAVRRLVAQQDLEPRRGLIIGYGSVGAASAAELRRGYANLGLDIVDANQDRLEAAAAHGFGTARALPTSVARHRRYDLVVGCTGGTSFTWDNRNLLADVAVLASGSSAAVELDRARLVERADENPLDDFEMLNDRTADASNIHADIRFALHPRRRFTILRAGFPVNFDGEPEHVPTILIQPTHCLLYAAVVQALACASPGFRLLEPAEDYRILDEAVQDLAIAVRGADAANPG